MMKKLFLKLINFYQKKISFIHGPSCKFIPTCSEYSKIAIEKHGAFKGSILSIIRILRCNPFSKGGIDDVP